MALNRMSGEREEDGTREDEWEAANTRAAFSNLDPGTVLSPRLIGV